VTWEARSHAGICCCLVAKSCPTWRPHGAQHARLPSPSLFNSICSNSCSLNQWCYLTIASSATFFSFCRQSFLASEKIFQWVIFHISWPKFWGFSFNISPSNEYSGLISFKIDMLVSLLSKGLSRVFSSTTFQKHQVCRHNSPQRQEGLGRYIKTQWNCKIVFKGPEKFLIHVKW